MYRMILLFLIVVAACKNAAETKESKQQSRSSQPKKVIAQIHLTGLDDKPINLEDHIGKTRQPPSYPQFLGNVV